ncbi:MAG: porin [Arcobacter sp.]|nr:MAG: porin [Arcobacter sp.]
MNKKIAFSLAFLLMITRLFAGTDGITTKLKHGEDAKTVSTEYKEVENLSDMFTQGKASGQIRMFYLDRRYQGSSGASTHRDSTAIGGHLKYETATYNGVNLAAAFYTTNKIDLNQHGVQDPSLLGTGLESYSILGEAYVGYDFSQYGSQTSLKLGLQRYDTPMIGSDDARMLPNTFEAYKLVNKDLGNTSIQVAHLNKIAYGSFSNIYSGGMLASTAGYPAAGNAGTGKYLNMGEAAAGKNTSGVTNAQVKYTSDNFHMKASNDYAWDLYNTLYLDAGASFQLENFKPFIQAQVIKQNNVGNAYMKDSSLGGNGDIDSLYWAAKVGAKIDAFTAYIAYSQTTDNDETDASYKNAILSQFGGMPAFTQGMVTRHQFLAGTKATKVAASYSFKKRGLNLSAATYYASFDMDENSGYGVARTAYEPGFDIKFYPAAIKNLQLRFRGNFPRKFAEGTSGNTGWDEYRLIANYNF